MLAAPLAMLPALVVLGALGAALAALGCPPLLAAALLLTGLVLSCRAMHLDGVSDLADGLSASYEASRSLHVMAKGDVGPSGVAAVVLVLIVDVSALAALSERPSALGLAALAVLASRHTLAWACAILPAARCHGLGAAVARTVRPGAAGAGTVILLLLSVGVSAVTGVCLWCGPVCVASALVAAGLVLRRAANRLGGITGDVLGASIEVSLAAALAAAAVSTAAW